MSILVGFAAPAKSYAAGCASGGDILGFPTWYQYLQCDDKGHPQFSGNDIKASESALLVVMAIVVILMRLAGILAVVFIVVGGIKYTTSQGNPEGVQNAKNTIVNAAVGLVLTIVASGIVSFIARSIH